jgi:hypothetical protein
MIDAKIMILDGVIGRRGMPIQLPPAILAKNIILSSIGCTLQNQTKGVGLDR